MNPALTRRRYLPTPAAAVIAIMALCAACRPSVNAERLALQKEAEALDARHHALDEEVAAWSANVDRWMKKNAIDVDPARVVHSLSSRSYFMHESQHAASGDPEYAHLEDQMQEIQKKRKEIEASWLELRSRDRASLARMGMQPKELQRSIPFEFGDPTVPIPGVSARQRCCSLTIRDESGLLTGCKLTSESCRKDDPPGKGWHLVCNYECDPIVIKAN